MLQAESLFLSKDDVHCPAAFFGFSGRDMTCRRAQVNVCAKEDSRSKAQEFGCDMTSQTMLLNAIESLLCK